MAIGVSEPGQVYMGASCLRDRFHKATAAFCIPTSFHLSARPQSIFAMATLGEDLKSSSEKDFDEATTAAPTPLGRSTTNSLHSKERIDHTPSRNSVEMAKEEEQQDGAPLEPVESSMYPGMAKLIPILVAVMLSIFLVALDMTIVATAIPKITDQFQSLDGTHASISSCTDLANVW